MYLPQIICIPPKQHTHLLQSVSTKTPTPVKDISQGKNHEVPAENSIFDENCWSNSIKEALTSNGASNMSVKPKHLVKSNLCALTLKNLSNNALNPPNNSPLPHPPLYSSPNSLIGLRYKSKFGKPKKGLRKPPNVRFEDLKFPGSEKVMTTPSMRKKGDQLCGGEILK